MIVNNYGNIAIAVHSLSMALGMSLSQLQFSFNVDTGAIGSSSADYKNYRLLTTKTTEGRGFNSHPGQSFSLSLCGPISISMANAHMVYMGRKLALHITL